MAQKDKYIWKKFRIAWGKTLVPPLSVLWWNFAGVHSALGLPTVNLWTVWGVYIVVSLPVSYLSYIFWLNRDDALMVRSKEKVDVLMSTKV